MNVAQALTAGMDLGLARLDAQLLLLQALGRDASDRAWLLAHDTDPVAAADHALFLRLCARRAEGEPLAYIMGHKEFYGLSLMVDRRVLVPRPDTETLVDWALEVLDGHPGLDPGATLPPRDAAGIADQVQYSSVKRVLRFPLTPALSPEYRGEGADTPPLPLAGEGWGDSAEALPFPLAGKGLGGGAATLPLPLAGEGWGEGLGAHTGLSEQCWEQVRNDTPLVIDLGTGSGAIALALKKHRPGWVVQAVDASQDALDVAGANALALGLEVEFRHASWLEGAPARYDLIVSNPPYVAAGDPHLAALKHEPCSALAAGHDGLDDIRTITRQAPGRLRSGGWLLLEHGHDQAQAVRAVLGAAGFYRVASRRDLAGIERCSGGQWLEQG